VTERDKNGRFVKGSTGNPNGRPKRKKEQQYLDRMAKVVTLDDWEKIVKTAISRAKAGESASRKWLSDYLLGPPVQRLEADIESDNRLVIEVLGGYRNPPDSD